MEYEIIDRELNIKTCSIKDLTLDQVQSFLQLWNDGSKISTLTIFIDMKDLAVVLNKDNEQYELYLDICKKYLSATDENRLRFREKMKNSSCCETIRVLDNLIERRRNEKIIDMLGYQKGVDYPRLIFDSIIREYDFTNEHFRMWKAYTYGIIQGKKMERARRKQGGRLKTN